MERHLDCNANHGCAEKVIVADVASIVPLDTQVLIAMCPWLVTNDRSPARSMLSKDRLWSP